MKPRILEPLPPGVRVQHGDYTAIGVWRKAVRAKGWRGVMVRVQCSCGTVRDMELSSWSTDNATHPVPRRCSRCAKADRGKWNGKGVASVTERQSRRQWPMIRDAEHARELIAKGEWP